MQILVYEFVPPKATLATCMLISLAIMYLAIWGSWIGCFYCICLNSVSWHKGTSSACRPFQKAWEKKSLYSKVKSCFHIQVNLDYQVLKLNGDDLIPRLYFEPGSILNHCYYSCVIMTSPLLCRLFGRKKAFLGKYWLDHPLAVPFLSPLMPPAPLEKLHWWAS